MDVYSGVLYFVVYLDSALDVKGVYYKQYLPFDIKKSLKRCKPEQKTLKERFARLPDDEGSLCVLCREFVANKQKQASVASTGIKTLEEWSRDGIQFDKLELSKKCLTDSVSIDLSFFQNETYLYGITKWGQPYVLDKIEGNVEISAEQHANIQSGDYTCETTITIGENSEGRYLRIGGIRISSTNAEGEKSLSYKPSGDYHERYRDAEIMLGLLDGNALVVDGNIVIEEIEPDSVFADKLRSWAERFKLYSDLSDALHVKEAWNPDHLSTDRQKLDVLAEAFVRGNTVDLPSLEDLTVNINIDISASRIKVIASRRDDGRYDLYDPLSKELAYSVESLGEVPGEVRLMPGLFMMTIDDFSKVANLDAELFEEHLNTLPPNKGTKDFMTNKLFDMLQAYDSGAVCAQELIDCCCILAESLRALMEDDVSVINSAQVKLRKGEPFDRNEIERIALTSSTTQSKASAYIILGNKSLAEKCLELIPEKEREVYETCPIYNLFVSNTAEREGVIRKHR